MTQRLSIVFRVVNVIAFTFLWFQLLNAGYGTAVVTVSTILLFIWSTSTGYLLAKAEDE